MTPDARGNSLTRRSEPLKDGMWSDVDVKTDVGPHSVASVLGACPSGEDLVVLRDGASVIVAVEPDAVVSADGTHALDLLDRLTDGWWAGFLSYDLGRAVERVPALAADDLQLPDLMLGRFDARLVLEPGRAPRIEGDGASAARLDRLLSADPEPLRRTPLGPWTSSIDRPSWDQAVAAIHGHLRAGDCYQVNLTRRLSCETAPGPLELFRALSSRHPAPHEALIRLGHVAVVSASPERFLRRDGARIETRPIKGTSDDPAHLVASAKDRAENVMIVDLSRNDLGRICAFGSVRVPALFDVEEHPGLYHLVSTVTGTLRDDVTPGDIVRATFPPASVTGCPKPRVLQIIEELEPVRRGVYCGAVGFIDADRDVIDLNVAIRTFTITGGGTSFGVGGGIVADSDAGAEWDETELKARRLLGVASGA
jgi:para-aminobenzoate synthetase component I